MTEQDVLEGVELTDVAVIAGDRTPDEEGTEPAGEPPVELAPGLRLERLPHDDVEAYLDASIAPGLDFHPARQFGQRYSFVRRNAPQPPFYGWDPDLLIQHAMQLGRLVRANSHSAEHTVRIIDSVHSDRRQLVPGSHWLAWHAPDGQRKWLSQAEAEELARLLRRFLAVSDSLPLRVNRGLRLAEDSARTEEYLPAVIWTVAATEALLNTDDYKLRRQFVERSKALADEIEVEGLTADVANAIYTSRSKSVHGAVPDMADRDQALLDLATMQRLLRTALRRAIEEEDFRAVFASDDSVRSRWPVALR